MPDITMCKGTDCPLKDNCYRHNAKPSEFRQSYFVNAPLIVEHDKSISCDYFWLASWGPDDGKAHTKPQWCDIWQFTSRGTVYGIGENCVDCDIVYNTDMKLLINDKPDPDVKNSTFNGTITITETDKEINIHITKED